MRYPKSPSGILHPPGNGPEQTLTEEAQDLFCVSQHPNSGSPVESEPSPSDMITVCWAPLYSPRLHL